MFRLHFENEKYCDEMNIRIIIFGEDTDCRRWVEHRKGGDESAFDMEHEKKKKQNENQVGAWAKTAKRRGY